MNFNFELFLKLREPSEISLNMPRISQRQHGELTISVIRRRTSFPFSSCQQQVQRKYRAISHYRKTFLCQNSDELDDIERIDSYVFLQLILFSHNGSRNRSNALILLLDQSFNRGRSEADRASRCTHGAGKIRAMATVRLYIYEYIYICYIQIFRLVYLIASSITREKYNEQKVITHKKKINNRLMKNGGVLRVRVILSLSLFLSAHQARCMTALFMNHNNT